MNGILPYMRSIICLDLSNTTAYHLGQYEPSSLSTKELHALVGNAAKGLYEVALDRGRI